jgi:phosphoribosyl 1,2-cyclic phosphodiesterase
MKATIWGCRGSLATPGASTVGYGGNTSCVEVRPHRGGVIILDAGTGIRRLGARLADEGIGEVDLLLTHLHLDHIEGLGFFEPLFDAACTIRVHGPRPDGGSLEEQIAHYLSPPYFPVPFERIPARIEFLELWRECFELDGVQVTSAPVEHPGPTVGYRLDERGRSVAFIPDNEPGLSPASGLELAAGVDVLIHDAQYTDEEYETRVGWGHTSQSDLVRFVGEAAPGRTVLFHHDPAHDDRQLEQMAQETSARLGSDTVELAREGRELDSARFTRAPESL